MVTASASPGSTGSSASSSGSGVGVGAGSSWSWIGDIVKVVGGVTNNAFAMDQNNRKYKYDLYAPLTYDNKTNQSYILIGGMILIVLVAMIFLVLHKSN